MNKSQGVRVIDFMVQYCIWLVTTEKKEISEVFMVFLFTLLRYTLLTKLNTVKKQNIVCQEIVLRFPAG